MNLKDKYLIIVHQNYVKQQIKNDLLQKYQIKHIIKCQVKFIHNFLIRKSKIFMIMMSISSLGKYKLLLTKEITIKTKKEFPCIKISFKPI